MELLIDPSIPQRVWYNHFSIKCIVEAKAMLDQFVSDITDDIAMKNLYTAEDCHFIMAKEIKLGFFYSTNEYNCKNCDDSAKAAEAVANNRNEDDSEYVRSNIGF